MIFVYSLLLGFAVFALTSVVNQLTQIIDAKVERKQISQVQDAARIARLHLGVFNHYPSSQAELVGFANSIGERVNLDSINYVYIPNVVGTLFTYERIIIYSQNSKEYVDKASFEAMNTCGTGLDDDAGYCAPLGAKYTVLSADAHYQNIIRTINFRMNEAFYKITQTYDGRAAGFPNQLWDGSTMAVGSSVTVASFVGYAGLAKDCSGSFKFSTMFINCSDMFDEFGNPILYYYKGPKEIFLIASTGLKDKDGNPITISRYAKV